MTYLDQNLKNWQRGYDAPNVESWVFRWYGRILKGKLGVTSGTMLDWGCGQGAAVDFFRRHGFDAYGVDIAKPDIERGQEIFPEVKLKLIGDKPDMAPFFPGVKFDVVISIQSFYFLSPEHIATVVKSLHSQMNPDAILYASMIDTTHKLFRNSTPTDNGMRHVKADFGRKAVDSYLTPVSSKEELAALFPGFEPVLIGYYDHDWGEGSEKHWHITAKRI